MSRPRRDPGDEPASFDTESRLLDDEFDGDDPWHEADLGRFSIASAVARIEEDWSDD